MLHKINKKPMYLHTLDKLIDLKKVNYNIDEIIFVTKYDEIINNLKNKEVEVESSDDENPFVHNINKVKEMENKSDESNDDSIKFSISTLEISEDE